MNVLVVGASGYIGKNFASYASSQDNFSINAISSREEWKTVNFENYDSVLFAAGIAHRKQTAENAELYFKINYELAVSVAQKAKSAKVPHFVYLSSLAVYGKKEGEISANTKANPRHNDYYGKSKLAAEDALKNLADANFKIAILRPPMVYGSGCPGKFAQLEKIAKYLPIVPNNNNKRSIIYIEKLSEILCTIISERSGGIFLPQDDQYANTAELIRLSRQKKGKKTVIINMGYILNLCMAIFPQLKTAFGSLYYLKE
ncbi:MAG: NAD-dependent epimerase/dehydratase family protein [Defluviitaleaceae bacterium]|nr:NAD-dependent epimerase/dehydratase family protein [Defluviitaleaceae bacterium]